MGFVFRTILTYDYKKHSDAEVFTQPSLTDPSEYEPLEALLARCLRGDYSRVVENNEGFDENATDDEIIGSLQPQERESFDISDKSDIEFKAEKAVSSLKAEKKGAEAPETSVPEESKTEKPNHEPASDEGLKD